MVKYNKLYMCIYTCLEIPVPITQTTVAHTNAPFFYWILGLTTLRPFHTYPLQNQHKKPGKLDFKDYTPQKND